MLGFFVAILFYAFLKGNLLKVYCVHRKLVGLPCTDKDVWFSRRDSWVNRRKTGYTETE